MIINTKLKNTGILKIKYLLNLQKKKSIQICNLLFCYYFLRYIYYNKFKYYYKMVDKKILYFLKWRRELIMDNDKYKTYKVYKHEFNKFKNIKKNIRNIKNLLFNNKLNFINKVNNIKILKNVKKNKNNLFMF